MKESKFIKTSSFVHSMIHRNAKWTIDDYDLIIDTPTGGEITSQVYEMVCCPNETIQKIRDDWITFNSEKIILRVINFNPNHPLAHPKMQGNKTKHFGSTQWKAKHLGNFVAQCLISGLIVDYSTHSLNYSNENEEN